MSSIPACYGHYGVWMIYDYEHGPYAISIHERPAEAARVQAKQAYGRVGFWPLGMTLKEAADWWEEREKDVGT